MMGTASRERRVGRARSALDDTARRRPAWLMRATEFRSSPSGRKSGPGTRDRARARKPKKDEPDDMQAEPFDKLRTTLVEAGIECPSTGSGHSLG